MKIVSKSFDLPPSWAIDKSEMKNVAIARKSIVAKTDIAQGSVYTEENIKDFLSCYEFTLENFNTLINIKTLNKQIVNHFLMNLDSLKDKSSNN